MTLPVTIPQHQSWFLNNRFLTKPITAAGGLQSHSVWKGTPLPLTYSFTNKTPLIVYQKPCFLCVAPGQINISIPWGSRGGAEFTFSIFSPRYPLVFIYFISALLSSLTASTEYLFGGECDREVTLFEPIWLAVSSNLTDIAPLFLVGTLSGIGCRPLSGQQGAWEGGEGGGWPIWNCHFPSALASHLMTS